MYQTYQQKMAIVLPGLTFTHNLNAGSILQFFPILENLTLIEYHNILEKDNVLVVTSPKFAFDLNTMEESKSTNGLYSKASLIQLDVETHGFKNLNEIEWDDNYLYFFYSGAKLADNYTIRLAKIEKSRISKAIKKFEATQRITKNFHIDTDSKHVRNYVKSAQFDEDKSSIKLTEDELGSEYREYHNTILTEGLECK